MDYSLLCGVDENSGQLLLGIVDYMRTYTFDKVRQITIVTMSFPENGVLGEDYGSSGGSSPNHPQPRDVLY